MASWPDDYAKSRENDRSSRTLLFFFPETADGTGPRRSGSGPTTNPGRVAVGW